MLLVPARRIIHLRHVEMLLTEVSLLICCELLHIFLKKYLFIYLFVCFISPNLDVYNLTVVSAIERLLFSRGLPKITGE